MPRQPPPSAAADSAKLRLAGPGPDSGCRFAGSTLGPSRAGSSHGSSESAAVTVSDSKAPGGSQLLTGMRERPWAARRLRHGHLNQRHWTQSRAGARTGRGGWLHSGCLPRQGGWAQWAVHRRLAADRTRKPARPERGVAREPAATRIRDGEIRLSTRTSAPAVRAAAQPSTRLRSGARGGGRCEAGSEQAEKRFMLEGVSESEGPEGGKGGDRRGREEGG